MGRAAWLNKRRDRLSFCFMVIGIAFVIYWDVTVVAPAYYPNICLAYIIHFIIVAFLTLNIAVNIYWVVTEAQRERRFESISNSITGLQLCNECHQAFPPFSYHCHTCKICSFKRDHHCVFTGTCINFYNICYFMKALWYLWIASVYGVFYNFDYTWQNMGKNVLSQLLFFLCPPLAFALGEISPYGLLVIILELTACLVLFLITTLIYIQLAAIVRGQTRYEHKHGINPPNRDKGWLNNFEATLGTKWYLIWLFPILSLPLPDIDYCTLNTHAKTK